MSLVRTGIVVALVVAGLAFPGVQAQSGSCDAAMNFCNYDIKPSGGTTTLNVDLQQNKPTEVRFRLDTADYGALDNVQVQGIVVNLAKVPQEIQVQMAPPASGTTWVGTLAVSHRDLTSTKACATCMAGQYDVTVTVATATGSGPVDTAARKLMAIATETVAPTIQASGETADGKVRLGFGDDLVIFMDDAVPSAGIQRVTYNLTGKVGTLPLDFPYVIGYGTFRDGPQTLNVTAVDRAGNVRTKSMTVIADATAPQAAVTLPPHVFVGVPATIHVAASDVSPYNVTLRQGETSRTLPGKGPVQDHAFEILAKEPGPLAFSVTIFDILGNRAESSYNLVAEVLSTDSSVTDLALSSPYPLVGEPLTLTVKLAQDPGFVVLDFNVTISGAIEQLRNATLPVGSPATLSVPLRLPAGRYNITANITAPAGVHELNAGDQQKTLSFEVFFGRVDDGNRTYHIRAGEFGVPVEALRTDGKTLPLHLVQEGSHVVYQFADGDRNMTWNPNAATASPTPTPTTGSAPAKDSPGAALPLAALALAALALARRQR